MLDLCCVLHMQENLHSWMLDKMGRDQFVIKYGLEVVVYWNDGRRYRADEAYRRQNWTETFVQWSPMGNMLATMHRQGVAVWGGPSFSRLMKYSHNYVQLIEFSPAGMVMIQLNFVCSNVFCSFVCMYSTNRKSYYYCAWVLSLIS